MPLKLVMSISMHVAQIYSKNTFGKKLKEN